ncbi:MAG: ABC transporter permease [Amylibacter sp.]|nr:ABC transporter permease [Amylibacter sp.]
MSDKNLVLASDGTSLKRSLARSLKRQKIRALLLIAPLLLFVLLTFIAPIADMLFRSVENSIVADTLPQTVKELASWDSDSGQLPSEAVYAALARDLKIAVKAKNHTKLGSRLNYQKTGTSSLFRQTGRKIKKLDFENTPSFKDAFEKMNKKWSDPAVWQTIQQFSNKYTDGYFLAAADLTRTSSGIEEVPEDQRIYYTLLLRTLSMSVTITFMCILLGYPVAFLLATLPLRSSNVLMILVLLPFWTSLLVRTSAWKVLLQNQGVINDFLVWIGIVADGNRLELINNVTGTVIAMTHILLPFMILPLFSVMKTIPPTYMRAAKSMGANDFTAFRRVYFPQSIPGIGAGSILVFILSIGYYITPEIVGGTKGVFISNRIAYHISSSLNWGLGAALGAILLVVVLALYWLYDKFVGIDNVKLG